MLRMGSNVRGFVISGGFTASLAIIGVAFRLGWPDLIVPSVGQSRYCHL
jgi:hypothetical protein